MKFRNLDFLSPSITLYYRGKNKHSSVFSGIITILSYTIILACIIYYLLDFFERVNPIIYFFNRYVEDAGKYPFDDSSIFHYINLIPASKNPNIDFDFNSIRIYGINITLEAYLNIKIDYFNHWEYDHCNYDEDINNNNFKKIINKTLFSKSACIKKYYNAKKQRFYNKGETGFVFPSLDHGASHPNRTIYGIIIETCQNNSLKTNCNSIEEIESFFSKHALSLNFIDHYADVLNYNEPISSYINSITDGLTLSTSLTLNNLNFNPNLIRTHNGIFKENLVEEKSYSFTQNEKMTVDLQGKKIGVTAFYFWMQNNMIYNERYYKKFQDLLSNIGGLGSFILLIGVFINSFINPYIIILDTQDLIFRINDKNSIKHKENKKTFYFQKEKDNVTVFHNINENVKNNFQSSKILLFSNGEREKLETNYLKKKNKTNTIKYLINKKKNISNINNTFNEIDIENFFEIKYKNNQVFEKPIKKQKFSWCSYILYIMFFKSKKYKIKFYEYFRAEMLSEEILLQNNLDIYKLLKYCNIKRTELIWKK